MLLAHNVNPQHLSFVVSDCRFHFKDSFLEDDSGPIVTDELARRQKVRYERSKRKGEAEDPDELNLDDSLKGGKWKEQHMHIAAGRHSLSWCEIRLFVCDYYRIAGYLRRGDVIQFPFVTSL